MNDFQYQATDTPLRRITTFVWGLALFGIFGLASVIAYFSISDGKDANDIMADERTELRAKVNKAQSELLLAKPPAFESLQTELLDKPSKSAIPALVPIEAAPVADAGPDVSKLDGKKLFLAKNCQTCHGPEGDTPIATIYPTLIGKEKAYLVQRMKDIKSGVYTTQYTALMKPFISQCNDAEIEAISQWLAAKK